MSSEGAVLRGDLKEQTQRLVSTVAELRDTVLNLHSIDRLDALLGVQRAAVLAAREMGRGWLRPSDAWYLAVLVGGAVLGFAADMDADDDDDDGDDRALESLRPVSPAALARTPRKLCDCGHQARAHIIGVGLQPCTECACPRFKALFNGVPVAPTD